MTGKSTGAEPFHQAGSPFQMYSWPDGEGGEALQLGAGFRDPRAPEPVAEGDHRGARGLHAALHLAPHAGEGGRIVRGPEEAGADHEGIHAGRREIRDRPLVDAAVGFDRSWTDRGARAPRGAPGSCAGRRAETPGRRTRGSRRAGARSRRNPGTSRAGKGAPRAPARCPGCAPQLRTSCRERLRCTTDSACTLMCVAPAAANFSMNSSGLSIIRCASMGSAVTLRTASTVIGPMVRLGTKCPSITSTWIQSAPAALHGR